MYEYSEYYNNGNLKVEGYVVNNQKQGKWNYYFESGEKEKEINYKDDKENGIFKRWFKNGKLAIESHSVMGKAVGVWTEYYENGSIKEIGEYIKEEYCPKDFWDENGEQLLKDGTGKTIEKYGYLELDVYEQYFENGNFIKEIKISSLRWGGFIPDDDQ